MAAADVKRFDPLSTDDRSQRMSKVRSTGNRSTEMRVAATLVSLGIRGWQKHPPEVLGKPDFLFTSERVAVFVDGCFWHGCPYCRRNTPVYRRDFWKSKIDGNRRRDRRIRSDLRAQGYKVICIWEHSLNNRTWLTRLRKALEVAVRHRV
jgi:DNA mismatch endonuclease, patch repair protein